MLMSAVMSLPVVGTTLLIGTVLPVRTIRIVGTILPVRTIRGVSASDLDYDIHSRPIG